MAIGRTWICKNYTTPMKYYETTLTVRILTKTPLPGCTVKLVTPRDVHVEVAQADCALAGSALSKSAPVELTEADRTRIWDLNTDES